MANDSKSGRSIRNRTKRSELPDREIVELSEMTVGISAEDEAILDLTEEIVGGAFNGCSGASGKVESEEQVLDLSVPELEGCIQLEEEIEAPPRKSSSGEQSLPVVTPAQFEAALERVVRKAFGEKIDRILNQVIERTVSNEIETLKEILLSRGEKQD